MRFALIQLDHIRVTALQAGIELEEIVLTEMNALQQIVNRMKYAKTH